MESALSSGVANLMFNAMILKEVDERFYSFMGLYNFNPNSNEATLYSLIDGPKGKSFRPIDF